MTLKNPKAKGSRNERRTMAVLEAAGYRCVKSGGSLGEWDVAGFGPRGDILVQVKSNRLPSPMDMAILRESCAYPHVTRLVHVWYDHKRMPRVVEL